jgi:hypothetical protein
MDEACDGGGNRHLSDVDLRADPPLKDCFDGLDVVPAGVCSLRPTPDSDPWIVCPRRLLVMGRAAAGKRRRQVDIERVTIDLFEYAPGTRLGVWPELKLKVNEATDEAPKRFDYTFDYVLMPLGDLRREDEPDLDWERSRHWQKAGYEVDLEVIRDAPVGRPAIIEIMTSSTSGGNKRTGTTIPKSFRQAILDGAYAVGPGINYRQVWARMASQLIVKSEVAAAWGGAALWVIQDVLADYISDTTALDLTKSKSEKLSEINILSLSYGSDAHREDGVIELPDCQLYAGPIAGPEVSGQDKYGFLDIVRAGVKPRRSDLVGALLKRRPINEILVS